jgi:hypothetical protein
MVDAGDLKSPIQFGCAGSSPAPGIKKRSRASLSAFFCRQISTPAINQSFETFARQEITNIILQIRYSLKQNENFCRETQVNNAN